MKGRSALTKAGRQIRLAAAAGAALAVVLLMIPLFGDYVVWMTANMLILALFAVGFNLLFSFTGLLSFGQAGFFAVGGYVCALVLLAVPSLLLGVAAGVVAAGVVALIIGFLCVRHTEIYFAMLTLAFGMMIHSIIWKWRSVTGGDDGLVGVPRAPLEVPGLLSVDMADLGRYYYFVLVLVALGIFAIWRVVRSSLGLTLQGIRDSDSRVTFVGLSVVKYRLIAFTIAGLASGLAGALMIAPGFISDMVALLLLFPPTRAGFRVVLMKAVAARGRARVTVTRARRPGRGGSGADDIWDVDSWEDPPRPAVRGELRDPG